MKNQATEAGLDLDFQGSFLRVTRRLEAPLGPEFAPG